MSLRNRVLDAVIDGKLGNGITIARADLMDFFKDENPNTTGVFLSNSEMETGAVHSPTYEHFTMRIRPGLYRLHPQAILDRMTERKILGTSK